MQISGDAFPIRIILTCPRVSLFLVVTDPSSSRSDGFQEVKFVVRKLESVEEDRELKFDSEGQLVRHCKPSSIAKTMVGIVVLAGVVAAAAFLINWLKTSAPAS